jgi:type I restriction-modification system DNA methylase subunit
MPLFQQSVIKKHIEAFDAKYIEERWQVFRGIFHSAEKQTNIRNSKEEQYQEGFLRDLFVNVLGYTINPEPNFNLLTEQKNITNSKKADGAILVDGKALAVIELKGTETTDLTKIEAQAFGYKSNQPGCNYVITSNFEKLRFYIDNTTQQEEFNLFTLTKTQFELLYACLAWESIKSNTPTQLLNESVSKENTITKSLYKDYSEFKRALFENLVELNPQFNKLELFKKTQKLLDRFLFIFFAEDRGLLPTNLIFRINKEWENIISQRIQVSLYDRYKMYFNDLNVGAKVTLPAFGKKTGEAITAEFEIFAYNGGLFVPDDILDNIKIDDTLLHSYTQKMSHYNFESDVDVNILGHIFENSLNEIDEIKSEIEGNVLEKTKTRRKKDGVFYTPKYITKYIVDNTVGKLCTEKKEEIKLNDEDFISTPLDGRSSPSKTKKKALLDKLSDYRNWLLDLTICDPACGSGAFLNQALEFLIAEHRYVDELQAKLLGDSMILSDIENSILERNIYGVDLNDESVEIAKLSLWLRTAQKGRKLNSLNNNIKCGNSLIDDPEVAGDKAFSWEKEFPEVFAKGGFDVVIGNPPYGAFISKEVQKFYTFNYTTTSYKLDTYAIFIERGINITKNEGSLGYIIPYTFLTIQQHKKLREYILNFNIEKIIDLPTKIFESADLDTVILMIKKEKIKDEIKVGKVENQTINLSHSLITKDILNNNDSQINLNNSSFDFQLINKIKSISNSLNFYCEVSQGYIPYRRSDLIKKFGEVEGNKIVDERLWHSFIKQNDTWKQEIQGQDIGRYSYKESFQYVKYGTHVASYVNPKFFNSPRIIIMEITRGNRYKLSSVYLEKEFYNTPSIINIISRKNPELLISILAIINSRLLTWFHLKVNPKANAETSIPKILINDVRYLPISNEIESNHNVFYEKSNLMLNLNSDFKIFSQKFSTYFSSQYNLDKLPGKLEKWYELEFNDFIKELNKAIKAVKGTPLTKKDEFEWMDLFEENKKKAQDLKAEIDKTDKEIDQMVYELYGLSEEEIAIVENA